VETELAERLKNVQFALSIVVIMTSQKGGHMTCSTF
jgi:hypothetical protein